MKANIYDITGKIVKETSLNKEVFEAKINDDLMAQAIRVYQGNQRASQAKTLTRSDIARTTKKVYRQKGTGGARHGSRKAPIYVGGGVAHGPTGTQNYSLKLSQKMKNVALKSALSQKAQTKNIFIVEGLGKVAKPKTKIISTFLTNVLGDNPRNVAIVFDKNMDSAIKSSQNLAVVNILDGNNITTFDVIKANSIFLSFEAMENIVKRLTK